VLKQTLTFPASVPLCGGQSITLREPRYDEVLALMVDSAADYDRAVNRQMRLAQACIVAYGGADDLDVAAQARIWNERLSNRARALLREWIDRCVIPQAEERAAFLASAAVLSRSEGEVRVRVVLPESLPGCGGRALVLREPTAGEVRTLLIASKDPSKFAEAQFAKARACVLGFEENASLSEEGRLELWNDHLCARAWTLLGSWIVTQMTTDDEEAEAFFRGAAA